VPPEQVPSAPFVKVSKRTQLTLNTCFPAGFAAYLAALADPSVSYVTLLLRREIPSWANLPSNATEKSKTIIVKDFTRYPEDVISQIADHDGCVWALGKSVSGLSEEEYMKIHVDFPVAAVEALKKAGVGNAEKPFTFVYVSGEGSDPSQKSMFMWSRGKVRISPSCQLFCGLMKDAAAGPCRDRVGKSAGYPYDQAIGHPSGLLLPCPCRPATESARRHRPVPRYCHRLFVHQFQHGITGWNIGELPR